MGFGGKGGSQTVVNRNEIRPEDAAYLDQYRKLASQQAQNVVNGRSLTPGLDPASTYAGRQLYGLDQFNPLLNQAAGGYGSLFNMGFTPNGLNTDAFMNPYISNVVDATNAAYDRSGQQVQNAAADMATRQGAYGGDRSAILQSEGLAQNELARNQAISGLYQSGFNNAQQMAAQLGMAGLGGLSGLGQYQKGLEGQKIQGLLGYGDYARNVKQAQMMDPYMRAQMGLGMLGGGMMFPGGTSTQTTESQQGWLPTLLGAGATIGGLGLGGPLLSLGQNALFGMTGMGGTL